jgi:hypothetical protein
MQEIRAKEPVGVAPREQWRVSQPAGVGRSAAAVAEGDQRPPRADLVAARLAQSAEPLMAARPAPAAPPVAAAAVAAAAPAAAAEQVASRADAAAG